uniref:Ral GTPase activating protein catalytic subunit alpha 2 n=1 Tax=Urocitellus parryii TaxID=9999 RepID=A0A8D2H3S9_UROPR
MTFFQTVGGGAVQERVPELDSSGPTEQDKNHSNSSTLSDRRLSNTSLCSIEEEYRTVYEMVQRILLSTRGYVNFVNEVFRQAFLLPSCEIAVTRKVVQVYRKWILQDKPVFMEEPDKKDVAQEDAEKLGFSETDHKEVSSENSGHKRSSSWGRTYSFTSAMSRGCVTEEDNTNVKAGAQAMLQVFLTNAANVFLLEPCAEVPVLLKEQVDACKAVLIIFRRMIMELTMNKKTWEQMLQILLRITEAVMQKPKDKQIKDLFAQSLAGLLFRTLIVAWIRANLYVYISRELWDDFLGVLSSLTEWEELISEWANIMDSLTAVLARTVYGVEMTNLPLDKLSEQKEKKQRGKGCVIDSQKGTTVGRSFSLSWRSHPDVTEPMRFRSATTSGAPGVEKARNIVRQKATEVEECQQSENVPVAESGHLMVGQQQVLRSSSTSDITEPLCSDSSQGAVSSVIDSECRFWLEVGNYSSECLADDCSIIAGGNLTGWHPDSAAVLWRRVLGILGDVNNIQSPKIHAKTILKYCCNKWNVTFLKILFFSSPSPPVLIPPLRMFASWLFKATTLPNEYKEGKLQAYRLICAMMTRRQDVLPNSDFLVHFYLVMHLGLTSEDQDILNIIIRHCPPRFFSLGLPGFSMLVGDFITAAARVLSTDMLTAPRAEALTILGSLVCFPNTYQEIPLLHESNLILIWKSYLFLRMIFFILKTTLSDIYNYFILSHFSSFPSFLKRCIAICSLGVWICEELAQCTSRPQVKEAINVIGVTLKFPNKIVAQVACDILQLLVSYWEKLQMFETSLPRKMAEFIVSLLLCLLDWCMALPVNTLLHPVSTVVLEEQHPSRAPLLDYIYRVLHCCVCGSSTYTQQSHYTLTLADLSSTDYDPFLPLANVKSSEPVQYHSSAELGNLLTVEEEKRRRSVELIPLTARMVMAHLVNHLGHYPLSGGPAVLHSLVSENHDNAHVEGTELSSEVFRSPNLQLFVFNDSTLISYLQTPAEGPGGALSDVRVIVRDISGKYSWDGKVLYGPLEGCLAPNGRNPLFLISGHHHHTFGPQKDHSQIEEGDDVLDKLLENIGHTSPECLLPSQLNLNEPSPPPYGMNREQEKEIIEVILRQSAQEDEYVQRCNSDSSMKVTSQGQPSPVEPRGPFYFCRLLLDDLGMNSWDRRKNFHLLKKNSKLLRELKNLDSRQCRETHKIAVFYIAEGQEDKCSILSNERGSQAYEDFVAGLGWEVDLSTHCGFMGGLQRNGSTGQTAPYYATSTVEVIFHVSTRMPSGSDDSLTKKLRHLGNDEVHIVWSEHSRDYRRGIIPTAFGDVSIIIYPMKNHMFFIAITKKPEVPFFGPLFDGAIVSGKLLPSLICATCINASRAVKCLIPLYQSFYEERALYLEAIIQNHREVMTFEDFAAQVFSPSPSYSLSGTGECLHYSPLTRLRCIRVADVHLFFTDKCLQI